MDKSIERKVGKFLYWSPRILSLIFIAFLALFSLDVFGTGLGFWGTLGAFLLHNIPVFLLAIVLWIAWRREIVGGIAFILAGLLYTALLLLQKPLEWYYLVWALQISGIAFLIGGMFLANWHKKLKDQ